MKMFFNKLKERKGITIAEYVWILAFIGTIIAFMGPLFQNYMIGDPPGTGFAGKIIERQTAGVNEANHGNISVTEGCDSTISNCINLD